MMGTGRSYQLFLKNILRAWPHLVISTVDTKSVQALILPSSALKQASLLSLHRMYFSAISGVNFQPSKKLLVHYETWIYFFFKKKLRQLFWNKGLNWRRFHSSVILCISDSCAPQTLFSVISIIDSSRKYSPLMLANHSSSTAQSPSENNQACHDLLTYDCDLASSDLQFCITWF